MQASADGEDDSMKFWPDLKSEVMVEVHPFEKDGKPTAAEVEEYIDLVLAGQPAEEACGGAGSPPRLTRSDRAAAYVSAMEDALPTPW